jgi:hypothetical protein
MSAEMQFELGVVSDFIGANWANFCAFAESEFEMTEAQCEDITNHLDKLAGRS